MSRYSNNRPVISPSRSFHLDKADGKLLGVCGGIAKYFGVNPTWIRIAFAVGTIVGFGSLILVYLAIALIAD